MLDFCSYNIRGLHNKVSFVKDFVSMNKIGLIALLETHVKQENASFISSLVASRFCWMFNYDHHRNGRIWFGWDPTLWRVSQIFSSAQQISCHVSRLDYSDGCILSMIYAYNTGQDRRQLWAELHNLQSLILVNGISPPWCLIGDFNTFLNHNETNGSMPSRTASILEFRSCLNQLGVTDLRFTGQLLTWWDSNTDHPTMRKLDRVLVNDSWLALFSLSIASFLPKGLSDHCPATVSIGSTPERIFKPFQIFQHIIDDDLFLPTVREAWQTQVLGNPWFILTTKLKRVKMALKTLNVRRGNLTGLVASARSALNSFQESLPLVPSTDQLEEDCRLRRSLSIALANEEKLLHQKSRVKWLKYGDGNNSFFFNSCRGRWNTNKLLSLEDDYGVIHTSHRDISNVAVSYFKNILGTPNVVEDFPLDISLPSLSLNQIADLDAPFSAEDIYKVFKSMAKRKSPGPDGLTPEFFLSTWPILGQEVIAGVRHFFETCAMPRIINASAIALVPKVANPTNLSQYRPISCCNVLYKCVAKLLASRMKRIMPCIISLNQTAFVPGRRIGDNVMLAQSLCRDYHRDMGPPRAAIKLDIHKAFDTLNWGFLFKTMELMGFSSKFINWIKGCVTTCMVSVKINGAIEGFFSGASGLRQGDPLSPYLFVLAMEVLTACINKVASSSSFSYHWRAKEAKITHLIFADDVFLFCKGDDQSLNLLLEGVSMFSRASGLHPNPSKCSCFLSNVPNSLKESLVLQTGYSIGTLPVKYLGLPLISSKLSVCDCMPLIDKLCRKVEAWTCKFLSQAGRVQLIKVVLFGVQGYWSNFLFLPKSILKKIQSILAHFLWGASVNGPCQFKVAWKDCCYPKLEGGLGFKDLISWNKSAVLFQVWRIVTRADSLWICWLFSSPLRNKPFWTMKIPSQCSWCLRKIFKARDCAMQYILYDVGVNSDVLMWHDPWLNRKPIILQLDAGFISIMESTDLACVGEFLNGREWELGYSNHVDAIELRHLCARKPVCSRDTIMWDSLGNSRVTIANIWGAIRATTAAPPWIHVVWHPFSVPKFSILLWLVLKQRLLTKDRMVRFGINTISSCVLCLRDNETHSHLFWECTYTKFILRDCPVASNMTWSDLQNGNFPDRRANRICRQVQYLFLAAAFHAIWAERNNRIHVSGWSKPAVHLLHAIKLRVREKLFTCDSFIRGVRRDPTLSEHLF